MFIFFVISVSSHVVHLEMAEVLTDAEEEVSSN